MQCKCGVQGEEMACIDGFDTCSSGHHVDGKNYAFNLYLCYRCGSICKDNVWDNPGQIWVLYDQKPEAI